MRRTARLALGFVSLSLAPSGAAAQADPLDGEWVAVGGDFFGEPLPAATLPLMRIDFHGGEATWRALPGYPTQFRYEAYGEGVDSLSFVFPTDGSRSLEIPVRSARRGDTLVLAFVNVEPFDPDQGPGPATPDMSALAEPGPYMRLVMMPAGAATQGIPGAPPAEERAARAIDRSDIERRTRALTAPEMEGRESGRPGGERAARTIAAWFSDAGLQPLGEDGFLQPVPLAYARASDSSSLTIGDRTFRVGGDFAVSGLPMRTRARQSLDITGEVFLFGPSLDQASADASLPELDVRGKIVAWLAVGGPPQHWERDLMRTYRALHENGAAAILVLFPEPLPEPLLRSPLFSRVAALDEDLYGGGPAPAVLLLGQAPFTALFGDGSELRSFIAGLAPGESALRPTGKQVGISYRLADSSTAATFNVIGVIPGSDATSGGEAVVYTAHYDAFGVHDGRVYAGAADNALGVAEMVEIADALTSTGTRSRRSIVFIAVGAEERGMLGTLHWIRNPTWPLDRIVANVNIDGGDAEAWGPLHGAIDLTRHATLADLAAEAGAAMGLPVLPNDGPAGLGGSDFYDFLTACIPAIQLMGIGGDPARSHERMDQFARRAHQPGDVIDEEWDWTGPEQMAELYLRLGLRVANGDERPGFKPGSPYASCQP